jgi:hypothetical protein
VKSKFSDSPVLEHAARRISRDSSSYSIWKSVRERMCRFAASKDWIEIPGIKVASLSNPSNGEVFFYDHASASRTRRWKFAIH